MGKLQPTDFYIYRWRYYIGYGLVVALLAFFLVFVGRNVPGALSQAEMDAVVHGSQLSIHNPESLASVSSHYYSMQRLSIHFFGVTPIGIKLVSLVLAFFTAIGAVLLLRRWFHSNIAILATLLLITTGQFLFVAQSGTPGITYMLWSVWLLLSATMVTNKDAKYPRLWRVAFFLLAGLSLYAPLSLYLLTAIISAALLHPHVRFVIKQMRRRSLAFFLCLTVIPIIPLGYLIWLRPAFALELLGKPAKWPPDILHNASTLIHQYFDFITPSSTALMTPIFGLGSLALVGIGAWQLARFHYNARSYTIATWILLLLPVLLINPTYTSITFVPFLLLVASGLEYLLKSWYGLFPHNPYARVAGLIPLMVLIGGLALSGVDRYVYGYNYNPDIVQKFSRDSQLLNTRLDRTKQPISLVVSQKQFAFYRIVAAHASAKNHTSIVVSDDPLRYKNETATVIVSKDAQPAYAAQIPTDIISTELNSNADRFFIYKNTGI